MFEKTFVLFGIEMNISAQVFGMLMFIFVAIGYLTKGKTYFALTLCSSICCIFESLVLKVWSSAISVFLVAVRNILILSYSKNSQRPPRLWCYIIIALVVIEGVIFTFIEQDIWSALPPLLTVAETYFAFDKQEKHLKAAIIGISFGYVLFNAHAGAYVGVVRQIFVCGFAIAGFIKYIKWLKKQQNEVLNENCS